MNRRLSSLLAACLLASAGVAGAQTFASTAKSVHLRAGPARDYPVVAVLPPGTPVTVFGCLATYSWCDVTAGPDRGWVYAGNLVYAYGGRDVVLPSVAAVVGIGIVAFVLEDYWRDHYVGRWWWPVRRRWFPAPRVPPIRLQPGVPPPHAPAAPIGRPQPPRPPVPPLPSVQPRPPHAVAPAHVPPREPHGSRDRAGDRAQAPGRSR